MHEPIDINNLLSRAAKADNAALPFAQWKESLLKRAASYEGAADAPLDIGVLGERKRRPKRTLYRITGAAAGAAAVFILLLSVSGFFSADTPSPAAMESRQFAGAGEESAMDSAPSIPEAAVQVPELAAPEAAAPEGIEPKMDAGVDNSESGGANDMSPMALDPLIDEAIRAVDEALSAKGEAGQAPPYAYRELGGSFAIMPLDGGLEEKITLETAYIVIYPDGASYLVKPLDAGGVEVLGRIIAPNHHEGG